VTPDSSACSQRDGKVEQQSPGLSPPPSCLLGFEVLLLGPHTPGAWITPWLRPAVSTKRGRSSTEPPVHAKPKFVLFPPPLGTARCKQVPCTLLTAPGWACTALHAALSSFPGPARALPALRRALMNSARANRPGCHVQSQSATSPKCRTKPQGDAAPSHHQSFITPLPEHRFPGL